jgi:hypothetical protein
VKELVDTQTPAHDRQVFVWLVMPPVQRGLNPHAEIGIKK